MTKIYLWIGMMLAGILPSHALADLTLTRVTVPVARAKRGEKILLETTVKNRGNLTAGANYLLLYLGNDNSFSADEVVGRVSIGTLAPNDSQIVRYWCPISTVMRAGNYYMGFQADPYSQVAEDNESNLFWSKRAIAISDSVQTGRKLPYPVIFIHGLNSNSETWSRFSEKCDSLGWVRGGQLDYCLNPDGYQTTADTFIRSFADTLRMGDYYYINFDVSKFGARYPAGILEVYSNQSAIVKQGWAVKQAVKRVLAVTGASKVILVGHSMGGLASREYFQNPSNWQSDGQHHIAKLFTAVTPHGGSNMSVPLLQGIFLGIDGDSEAVRDLRYPNLFFTGWFLYGGTENSSFFESYHNMDVNCNGRSNDVLVGLRNKVAPRDINYACIISNSPWDPLGGDGVVADWSANMSLYLRPQFPYLVPHVDKFKTTSTHASVHVDNISTMIQGLDEPFSFETAYELDSTAQVYGHITMQLDSNLNRQDVDIYRLRLHQRGLLSVRLGNIPVPDVTLKVWNSSRQLVQTLTSSGKSQILFEKVLTTGDYFLELIATPMTLSYLYPYFLTTEFIPATPLAANFGVNTPMACVGQSVQFTNQSIIGTPIGFDWTFTGGTPNSSSVSNPIVTYSETGTYPVSLRIWNRVDTHTVVLPEVVTVHTVPTTDYSFNILPRDTVVFTNRTVTNGLTTTYQWSFGDSATSTLAAPVHKYLNRGNFEARLTASNFCGNGVRIQTCGWEVPIC